MELFIYAITTYSAQGTTVDRAFVMADPSMDKQELYVAASRSSGETQLYATPEVQVHREEIAPESPYLREGIPHIAEAAERDRAQLAAHDIAQLDALPTDELVRRRSELLLPASDEQRAEDTRERLQREIGEIAERLRQIPAEREEIEALPVSKRGPDLSFLEATERSHREAMEARQAEAKELPAVKHDARSELASVEGLLAERRELAVTAARISPPPYIKTELGERPSDPTKSKAWDRGVAHIERYRQEHGVKDGRRVFGREPKGGAERTRREQAIRRLRQAQRALGRDKQAARTRSLGRSLGIGR